jgi:hypothetical protein
MLGRPGPGDLLDLAPLRQRELRRPPAPVPGRQRIETIGVEVVQHVADRSSLVNATLAIAATSMPCADSSTICARRHVTTDPDPRRTIRRSRLPSSSPISRTRTRPAIPGSMHRQPASMPGLINQLPTGKRRRLRRQLCQETAQGCGGKNLPGW